MRYRPHSYIVILLFMYFGCSVSSTTQSADIRESTFKETAHQDKKKIVGDFDLQVKGSGTHIEKVFLKGRYLNLVGGFQIPNRPGAKKNIKFGYGQIDHITGTKKWVTSHPDSYVMELIEPALLGTGAPSTWPTMKIGRMQPVALDGKYLRAEAVFFLDADTVLTSARQHYSHGFIYNWIATVDLNTGVETNYTITAPENTEWTNFPVLQALGSGIVRLDQEWSNNNLNGNSFLIGRGGYDVLGSPYGPALALWNIGEPNATFLMNHPATNPEKRDAYYTFPKLDPSGSPGAKLKRFVEPVDGIGLWQAGDVGGMAFINHPRVKGLVATHNHGRGVMDYRAQGESGSGQFFLVTDPTHFYSKASSGNRGGHREETLNQAYPKGVYGRTGIVYDPDDIAAVYRGDMAADKYTKVDKFEWPRGGLEWTDLGRGPTLLGDLFWDEARQYLWMTLYSRGTTSTDMILVAYEIIVDDTRLEQPPSIPDGWHRISN